MTTLQLYDVDADIRAALISDCDTCHGEPLSPSATEVCPDCGSDPASVLTQALDALLVDRHAPPPFGSLGDSEHTPDIYREQIKMLALKLAMCLKETDAEVEALEAHQAAVAQRIRVRRNRIENTRQWAQLNMEAAGLSKIKNEFVTVYLQESREAIDITDIDAVPKAYKRVTLKMSLEQAETLNVSRFVTGTDVLKGQFLELQHSDDGIVCDADGVVVEGVTYRPKGFKRSLVVRS